MPSNNTSREFSYSRPITYKGVSYPSAPANLLTDGQQTPTNVFADANGNYFVLGDNGTAKSVMPVHTLDDVVVTPSKENLLSAQFNEYLTQSNDKTQVLDTPHREYNPHLRNKAVKGALSHNLWEQEHPNLTAWSQALSAVPFAVASVPLVGALGQSALATTAGQTARAGIASLMSNPIVEAANTGLGLGFAAKGVYDVSQGKFTPETAMDLAGGAGLIFKSLTGLDRARRAVNLAKSSESVSSNIDTPLKGLTRIPTDIKADAAQRYTNFINNEDYQSRLQRAGLEDYWDYMKNLTDRKVNGRDYFPGHVRTVINPKKPGTVGLSNTNPSSPIYGITLKESLPSYKISPFLNHEVSHWATENIGTNRLVNWLITNIDKENVTPIGDIMRYNESLVSNKPWKEVTKQMKQGNTTIKSKGEYKYLIESQEKRARAHAISQQAKDSNMSTDEFVDFYTTDSGNIAKYAPIQLRQMGDILTPENLKKYLRNFLSVGAPIGITELREKQ